MSLPWMGCCVFSILLPFVDVLETLAVMVSWPFSRTWMPHLLLRARWISMSIIFDLAAPLRS